MKFCCQFASMPGLQRLGSGTRVHVEKDESGKPVLSEVEGMKAEISEISGVVHV
jgi:hypothetical protein